MKEPTYLVHDVHNLEELFGWQHGDERPMHSYTQKQGLLDDIAHAEMLRLYHENPDRDDLYEHLRRLEVETYLREKAVIEKAASGEGKRLSYGVPVRRSAV
jgi:hypothetical protein